jgi:hypothetical protein
MWIAQLNGWPDDECGTVSPTACEAVASMIELYNWDRAWDVEDRGALKLEVYFCDQAKLPRVGYRVPEMLAEHWWDNGPVGSSDLAISDAQRKDLAERIDALVSEWAAETGVGPDWYEPRSKAALVAELEWCQEDRDGELLWQVRVSDEVWAMIEALDAPPVQLDEVAT